MSAPTRPPDAGMWRTLRSDVKTTIGDAKRTGYGRTVTQTIEGLESYYLAESRRQELAHMHPVRRFFYRIWWLFRALFYKLAPGRRVLLVAGILAIVAGYAQTDRGENNPSLVLIGMVCLLLVLMLELREKLVARDELAEGRAIQQALLPEANPAIPGFEVWLDSTPANDVGGDIVDVLRAENGEFFLLLGDVAGKGLGAALLAARFQATFRALAPDAPTLATLGDQLNRIFYRDGPSNRFATAVALAGTPGAPALRILNAGHPPPLLVRGDSVTRLPGGGPALGIIAGARYTEHTVTLSAGDTLVVYSDGVTEATNPAGEFFDEARLFATLAGVAASSPSGMGHAVRDAVRAFEGGERPRDDLSLALIRVA